MLKKILICALGLSATVPLTGCPQASAQENTATTAVIATPASVTNTTNTKVTTSTTTTSSDRNTIPRTTSASVSGKRKWTKRSGLRFGYVYANKADKPDADGDESKLNSPHMFTMGFELQQCMPGGKWLDVLFIQNVSITGLDQSVISPSARVLVGFEIDKSVQLAVGPQLSFHDPAGEDKYVHLTAAIGYTMDAGVFSVPVHFSFVPDVNDYWATAITTGVNW
jgi:hypothetical protein